MLSSKKVEVMVACIDRFVNFAKAPLLKMSDTKYLLILPDKIKNLFKISY